MCDSYKEIMNPRMHVTHEKNLLVFENPVELLNK